MAATTGIMQIVKDGEVVDASASANSLSSSSTKSNSSLDKEAFLQLLVAQMKYQDPLEPTSNTEYISQLATFSSLEEMQNLNSTVTDMEGSSLVGKQVIISVTSETTGSTNVVSGRVDYVTRENGKTYLSVEDNLYSIDDLESVVDDTYLTAIANAESFKEAMEALPDAKYITLEHKKNVEKLKDIVNSMTAYEQKFLDSSAVAKLQELVNVIGKLEDTAADKEESSEDTKKEDSGDVDE